jgi:type VI protein secretion system component Hcp
MTEIVVLMLVPEIQGSATLVGTDPGEDGSHEGWIPVDSCSFGFAREASSVDSTDEDGTAVKPVPTAEPVTIKRRADGSTAPILAWLANKEAPLKEKVLIDFCIPSGRFYLRYELKDVEIVSCAINFSAPDALSETIKLTYGYIKIVQRPIDITGAVDPSGGGKADYEVPRSDGGQA